MVIKKGYKRSHEFPNESFVQEKLEEYFLKNNFKLLDSGSSDLKCINLDNNEIWQVEAKGKTQQMGLDFRTCLGQVLQGMEDPEWIYAVALPDLPQYKKRCSKIQNWVRRLIKLNWIFVSEDGSVTIEYSD